MDRRVSRKTRKLNDSSTLQSIYDVLIRNKEEVIGSSPNRKHSHFFSEMSDAINSLTLADVGMDSEWVMSQVYEPLYIPIVEEVGFHIVLLVMPAGSCIPLHDHPNMTVFSCVLEGEMTLRAFNLLPRSAALSQRTLETDAFSGKAEHVQLYPVDCVFDGRKDATSGVWSLEPQDGNIHEFTALVPTVIFDVLMPPYNQNEGRLCTYYQEAKPSGFEDRLGTTCFSEVEQPSQTLPTYRRYFGPKIKKRCV